MQWRAWAMARQARNKPQLLPAAKLCGHYLPWLGAHSRLYSRAHPAKQPDCQLGSVTPGPFRLSFALPMPEC